MLMSLFFSQGTFLQYTMNNTVLEQTNQCKHLGVILQSDTKFTYHKGNWYDQESYLLGN